ncbi:MAG: IPT/TIG domain-containing protein [Fluviicola sp.]
MAAPNITSVEKNPADMNTKITIYGSNFTGAANVIFGSGPSSNSLTINETGTEISLTLPPYPTGTSYPVNTTVKVIVPGEPQGNEVPFTIVNPTKITSVSANPALVGNILTLKGGGFKGAINVKIDEKTIPAAQLTINDSGSELSFTVPSLGADVQYPISTAVTVNMTTVSSNSFDISVNNPTIVNTISLKNNSKLDPSKYTVWVAGFIEQQLAAKKTQFLFLHSDGSFLKKDLETTAKFWEVDQMQPLSVPNIVSAGNNRLIFLVTEKGTTPDAFSPETPYAAYPFKDAPKPCPPGPYDIFEFGPIAQYDVSAVDSFGLNLSFKVKGDPLTYGTVSGISRQEIGTAFTSFCKNDPLGKGFGKLLYSIKPSTGFPTPIDGEFLAIVSPKDWLAIYPDDSELANYWTDTVNDFFKSGNQLNFELNAANVGNYSGKSDGTKYTLTGPNNMTIVIPASDFAGDQGFIQAVRGQKDGESDLAYKTFGQIEAAIFEALSRGVALDGVVAESSTIATNYTSDAWTNFENWFTHSKNTYNQKPRVYDVYAKFFHYAKFTNSNGAQEFIFGENGAKKFGMAYGFSLDEDPNVGKWPKDMGVPAKTVYYVGFNQDVTLEIGQFLKTPSS